MPTIAQALIEAPQQIDRFEAKLLLAAALGKDRTYLIAHDRDALQDDVLALYRQFIERRLRGEPVPYILGKQEFFGRSFHVCSAVLIPRPDTETLIETVLQYCREHDVRTLLDLGTGSGCIAITLALELPQLQVFASDNSQEALAVARENAQELGARVRFYESDWFSALHEFTLFDAIVSNPPYIRRDDEHLLQLGYEPIQALTDGNDGLDDIRQIIKQAPRHLNRGGLLAFEHGWDQARAVRDLFSDPIWDTPRTVKDLAGNDRVTFARRHA